MKNLLTIGCLIGILVCCAQAEAVTAIGLADFSGSDTFIDFNSIALGEAFTNQYAGSGVTFSGNVVGYTAMASWFTAPGGTAGANWIGEGNLGDLTITFDTTITRIGFEIATNDADTTFLTAYKSSDSLGSIGFDTQFTSQSADFIAIEDLNGFDRLVIDAQGNGRFIFDNLRFGGSIDQGGDDEVPGGDDNPNGVPVPEPAAIALLGLGATGLYALKRKKK